MTDKELVCIWNTGGEHSGEVKWARLFNKQLKLPVCEQHLKNHKYIVRMGRYYNPDTIFEAIAIFGIPNATIYLRSVKGKSKRTVLKHLKKLKKSNKQRRQKFLDNL